MILSNHPDFMKISCAKEIEQLISKKRAILKANLIGV